MSFAPLTERPGITLLAVARFVVCAGALAFLGWLFISGLMWLGSFVGGL